MAEPSHYKKPTVFYMSRPTIDVCVMGAWGTGKTSLLNRYTEGFFEPRTLTTIGTDCCNILYDVEPITGKCRRNHKFRTIDDEYSGRLIMRCWDTAGQERFIALARSYIRQGSVFIVCCDGSAPLHQQVKFWFQEITICGVPPYKVIVVLTKSDLHDSSVKALMHCAFRELVNDSSIEVSYFETSAKENVGVTELFEWIARYGVVSKRRLKNHLDKKEGFNKLCASCCSK